MVFQHKSALLCRRITNRSICLVTNQQLAMWRPDVIHLVFCMQPLLFPDLKCKSRGDPSGLGPSTVILTNPQLSSLPACPAKLTCVCPYILYHAINPNFPWLIESWRVSCRTPNLFCLIFGYDNGASWRSAAPSDRCTIAGCIFIEGRSSDFPCRLGELAFPYQKSLLHHPAI